MADVIDAACGVERSVTLLNLHTADTQQWVDEYLRPRFERPQIGSRVVAQDVRSTSHALSELFLWLRCLNDRTDRIDRRANLRHRVGLIPALRDGPLRDYVRSAHAELIDGVPGVRLTANYTAHHSAIPAPGAHADIGLSWDVSMKVPDPPSRDTYSYRLLTFRDGRSAVEFGDDALDKVAVFAEAVLTAFENWPEPTA